MEEIPTDTLVQAYLAIRDEREKLLREYESKDAKLKQDMDLLETEMLKACNTVNADSLRTQHGTVIRRLNERFYTNDWENFSKFVVERQAVGLLERRIHQANFRQYLSEHQGEGLPPGINVQREYGITVRRANRTE
jgi:hypothetical protein